MIILPNRLELRDYQRPAWRYLTSGGKRAVMVWPRRHGKDLICANYAATAALLEPGNYWHMFPLSIQGRTALWNKVDDGQRTIDRIFPPGIRAGQSDVNMTIRLINGSTWQILGSDNYTNYIGANPRLIVFSEWSLTNPQAWEYLRPILRENGGVAIFVFTPRGMNHGRDVFDIASSRKDWFCELLTVVDTGNQWMAKEERRDGMPEELVQQEYYCSWSSLNVGSIYGRQMEEVERDGRITAVPYDRHALVDVYFDLGWTDATAAWLVQRVGYEVHAIDYIEDSFKTVSEYTDELRDRGYRYGTIHLPHDARQHHLSAGGTTIEDQFIQNGFPNVEIVGSKPITDRGFTRDRIDAVRRLLPRVWFDRDKCSRGVKALQSYRRVWDDNRKSFADSPDHDWSSHGCDAFGLMAVQEERTRISGGGRKWPKLVYPSDHIGNIV